MLSPKRHYVRLSAIDQLALRLAFIDTTERKISEERLAQCFNVVRLTVRNMTIGQGLTRGSLDSQMDRLRQLYEAVVGPVRSSGAWAEAVERAEAVAAARLERAAARQGAAPEDARAAA